MSGNDNPLLPGASSARYRPRFGKYRGKVIDNIDPEERGRIIAEVAAFPGDPESLGWCTPCVPYAGAGVGFFAMPPVGGNVWVEYEGGDPNYPIWSGCFWGPGELPLGPDGPLTPEIKMWKTASLRLVLNDTPEVGGYLLNANDPCVATPQFMQMKSAGIELNAEPAVVRMMVEEGVFLTYPPTEISMTPESLKAQIAETALTLSEFTATLDAPDIAAIAEGGIELHGGGEITIVAEGIVDISGGADVTIDAGAAVEFAAVGDISLAAAVDVNLTGVNVELTGLVTIDGQVPVVL